MSDSENFRKVELTMRRWRLRLALIAASVAIFAAACTSSETSTPANPTPSKCAVSLAPSGNLGAAGGAGTVTVTTPPECAWTASTEMSWISGLTPTSGQGNGQIQFSAAANTQPSPRQGDIVVNNVHARIQQDAAPCRIEVSPAAVTVGSNGGSASLTITTIAGCSWTATTQASWITVAAPAGGTGNGTVNLTIAANTGSERTATLAIGDQTVSVAQAAIPGPCNYTVAPTTQTIGASGGAGTAITVTTDATCSWTASSNEAWLTLAPTTPHTGNGTLSVTATANSGPTRIAILLVAGQLLTVNQSGGCGVTIAQNSQSIAESGGSGTVAVTAGAGCTWTASVSSNTPWLTIATGANGTGNGTVTFNVAVNTGAARTGTLSIAGHTFTVNQAVACSGSISPNSQTIAAVGGVGSNPIAVSAPGNCTWSALSNDSWITVTAGALGTGNGSVTFTAGQNTGAARNGTITIARQTFTLMQAGACTYTLTPPTSQTVPQAGGNFTVAVATTTGCTWTAAVNGNPNWIRITSGANGSGNGTVAYTVDQRTSGGPRSATLTIAGRTFTVNQN